MRKIIFRGKSSHNGEWVEGYLGIEVGKIPYIQWLEYDDDYHEDVVEECAVDPDTVGQYTGLTDKNGVRIFEGDIVRIYYPFDPPDDCVVYWLKESAKWNLPGCDGYFCTASKNCEIIGNIHDNPELLER